MLEHVLRCLDCKKEAVLPGCSRCKRTQECFDESRRIIEAFIDVHDKCDRLEVQHCAGTQDVDALAMRAEFTKSPCIFCPVCKEALDLPSPITDEAIVVTKRLVHTFGIAHEACGRIEIHSATGECLVVYETPTFDAEKHRARVAKEARAALSKAENPTAPCPYKCGGTITYNLAKSFTPGFTITCDRCGKRIQSTGAFDAHGNRL
jgi:hypothetical protein